RVGGLAPPDGPPAPDAGRLAAARQDDRRLAGLVVGEHAAQGQDDDLLLLFERPAAALGRRGGQRRARGFGERHRDLRARNVLQVRTDPLQYSERGLPRVPDVAARAIVYGCGRCVVSLSTPLNVPQPLPVQARATPDGPVPRAVRWRGRWRQVVAVDDS